MNKLETINRIRYKIIGNIKNKSWFKNYKYESGEMLINQYNEFKSLMLSYNINFKGKIITLDKKLKKDE